MTGQENELRVLVVAPTGRDGLLISNPLDSNGISSFPSATAEMALVEFEAGAGALILAEEALTLPAISLWAARIAEQPSWSDFPLILLAAGGEINEESRRRMRVREPLGNLVLLERPVRPETFVSTLQAALRSRGRQYQMRDYIARNHAAEEALRRSEKLAVAGRLAASISHEINNPLASVTNLLYLIGTSSSLQEAKKHKEIAEKELARISEIVTQTLRFYREPSKPTLVFITEIVDSALILYQSKLAYAEIAIERDFRECSPIVAMAGELRQVILNLIGNALDASNPGGRLRIRVSNTREHRNGARPGVRLTVADSGSGISPEIRKTLFEPFVGTKGDTGTGLGLWISSEIVNRHSGTIQVKSSTLSQSPGTVFSVFLPLEQKAGHRSLREASMTPDGNRKDTLSDSPPEIAFPMQREMAT
ncbi:MAG: ATP-binding protein [Terracidiphilus sp.]